MKYEVSFKSYIQNVEAKLEELLPPASQSPAVLHQAMRYAVLNGGKRFRPVLALAACEAAGGKKEDVLLPACALEFIHCYSLVHDDLPALDNDDIRRGQPTCHKQFGEANAILTGDALLTYAFEVLARVKPAQKAARLILEISTAGGTCGMIGGQVADLAMDQTSRDLPMLDYITIHKTGKLIKASSVCGAIAAGAPDELVKRLHFFGEFLGMAFQAVDDLLDGDGYLRLMSAKEIRSQVRDLIAKAKREIHPLGKKAEKLQALADFILERMPKKNYVAVDR